jgi:pyridoxine 5-phosphate synthase
VRAAELALAAGAAGITVHLREDRRHIQDEDLRRLRELPRCVLNLEMALTDEMVRIATATRPDRVTLVPERREELTTEGGLGLKRGEDAIAAGCARLRGVGLPVSLFLDPEEDLADAAGRSGATIVEIHTGAYANARGADHVDRELKRIERAARAFASAGLTPHAGHGLTTGNVGALLRRYPFSELSIGHSIVARAIEVGFTQAVREMVAAIRGAAAVALASGLLLASAVLAPPARGADDGGDTAGKAKYPTGEISGMVFGDFYYNVDGNPNHEYNSSGADSLPAYISGAYGDSIPKVIGEGLNGVAIRRIDLQLDNQLSGRIGTRFRIEADGVSLTSNHKLTVAVKDAYIRLTNAVPGGTFYFGMIPTPTWQNREDFWRYRSVEKTIADFHGLGNGSDLGVALKGTVDARGMFGYALMVGNGTGQAPENNRYKKLYLRLPMNVTGKWNLEPYVDYTAGPGGVEVWNYEIGGGFQKARATIGFQFIGNTTKTPGAPTQVPFGVSLFALGAPHYSMTAFFRWDMWKPDTREANRVDQDLYIFGVDWRAAPRVHIMPNVELTNYDAKGTAAAPPDHDMQVRLTFYYIFNKP